MSMTLKENLLESLKHGNPQYLNNCYTMCRGIPGDPCFKLIRGNRIRGTNSYDAWGTYIMFPEDAPAAIPMVTEANQVIKDIADWKDYVKVPDLRGKCSEGWEQAIAARNAIDSSKYLAITVMGTGIFEQMHMLMTFEDSLTCFYEEPEATLELIETIADYRLTYMQLICENLHPDMIVSHDDWGSKTSLFWRPEMWREFFKPSYKKLYDYLHSQGVIVMHHSDSYCEPLVPDMIDCGIDVWQGAVPDNDIVSICEKYGDKIMIMGGIDSVIDRADATEEEIRKETRRALDTYGKCKGYWPGMTYGGPGSLFPHVEPIIIDEINKYNLEHFGVTGEL